jgi:hypothetical protein
MWARVQAHHDAVTPKTYVPNDADSLGFANYLIYPLAQGAKTSRDFYDVTTGANPLPAGPGWDYPTGWGTPNLSYLIEDASGNSTTAPVSTVRPIPGDPPPIYATNPSGPKCAYAFYTANPSAPDWVTGSNDPSLAIEQGTFGLTPAGTGLRAVLQVQDMSETPPEDSTTTEYTFYWTNPSGDTSTVNAVETEIDSLGNITYSDGNLSETTAGGETTYNFTPANTNDATGTITQGPNGTVEVDVPLSAVGLKAGQTITAPGAFTVQAEGEDNVAPYGSIVDQIGPGNPYTVGEPTCVDPGSGG